MEVYLKRLLRKKQYHAEASHCFVQDQLNVHAQYHVLEQRLDTTFSEKLKPNLNKSNKHNISIHLKQVSKQPVVTLDILKLPSLKIKICLHLLSDVQFKNYFIGQASWFSFVKSSKFGISIHYIYLEICDVFVLPLFSICFWNLK